MNNPVIIVGAGLAGLSCARALHAQGCPVLVLEAAGHVGGRVTTSEVEGFLVDRGFQTMLTSYPNAQAVLDFERLDLHGFAPGALIQLGGHRYRFLDPWKAPLGALQGIFAPVASIADAVRIARLRADCLAGRGATAGTTLELLRARGFSSRVIERFFKPFFGGVFLERELTTGAAFFAFVFEMFARGQAVVPARGMRAIPEQIAAALPTDAIRLNTPVRAVEGNEVRLQDGGSLVGEEVILAVDPDTAAGWTGRPTGGWQGATTVSYAADRSPLDEPILLLNGEGQGPVNHVCVPSDVCPSYAPAGAALVSATVLGVPDVDDEQLDQAVRRHLREWFGPRVSEWRRLKVDRVAHALPIGAPRRPSGDRICCGDYLTNPSIDGALQSGLSAAAEVIARLGTNAI